MTEDLQIKYAKRNIII